MCSDALSLKFYVQVSESAGSSLDSEAVRLIVLLKSWIPATLNGYKINYYQSQPFIFRLTLTTSQFWDQLKLTSEYSSKSFTTKKTE